MRYHVYMVGHLVVSALARGLTGVALTTQQYQHLLSDQRRQSCKNDAACPHYFRF
jgi:putative component of membrane protein insertase Oxa1/YidC/SpoIIIJ protein YidD